MFFLYILYVLVYIFNNARYNTTMRNIIFSRAFIIIIYTVFRHVLKKKKNVTVILLIFILFSILLF